MNANKGKINYTSGIMPYDIEFNLNKSFTIRVQITMKDAVDERILTDTARHAFKRYPYFAKQWIRTGESYVFIDNNRPLKVYERTEETWPLNSEQVNYHLASIDYSGNDICFNLSHILAGAFGMLEWVRTTLYYYISEKYKTKLRVDGVKLVGEPMLEGERDFYGWDKLPAEIKRVGRQKPQGEFPQGDYIQAYMHPELAAQDIYLFEFDQKSFMEKAKVSDGSPATLISALMFRAVYKLWTDKKLPIQA